MKDSSIDILNLEWNSYPSRDRNISSLVSNYLRFQGYNVLEESVFRGFEMINKYHPRLLFIANGIGARVNFHLVKYASLRGIKVVTLISEGNFKDGSENTPQFLWGWNKDHHLYEDSHLQWSERTRNMSLKVYPELKNTIKVSGGCGFDIYKIIPSISKHNFLKLYGKERFSKVIGVGCWDFSPSYPNNSRTSKSLSEAEKERFRNDRDLFNKVMIEIIKANPSVLFVLKEHPGNVMGHYMSAIDGTEQFENVLILKKESIVDTISISDFWLTYESTTVIEAWMLGKQTCLLNPTGLDFPRANVYKGSPNYPDVQALQNAIDSFYTKDILPGYNDDEMRRERQQVLIDTIQWDDGLNHVRAGNEIISVLNSNTKKTRYAIPHSLQIERLREFILNHLKVKRSTIYKRSSAFSHKELDAYSSKLYNYQIDYYKKLDITKEELLSYKVI